MIFSIRDTRIGEYLGVSHLTDGEMAQTLYSDRIKSYFLGGVWYSRNPVKPFIYSVIAEIIVSQVGHTRISSPAPINCQKLTYALASIPIYYYH